ncbi:MAG: COX15/CtaA family protein [Pseudomonadota bacterium]
MRIINRLTSVAFLLAFVVVVLGAYVRLSDAGLGCPDWPGCYGKVLVPQSEQAVAVANEAYPERPVDVPKAWKEMAHRYLASVLGLVIIAIAACAWRARASGFRSTLPYWLVAIVIFQGMLGMWTVTLLVKPVIVLMHLFGGLTTLSLLLWLYLGTREKAVPAFPRRFQHAAAIGLVVLAAQIFLGGWTSTNYAALSCPDFPTCQTKWWPKMDFHDAFTMWRGLGVDYEGGVLSNASRVAIHVSHRIGALITTVALLCVAIVGWKSGGQSGAARAATALLALLCVQVGLGIGNVVFSLPLSVATAHNAVAAALVLLLVLIIHRREPHETAYRP